VSPIANRVRLALLGALTLGAVPLAAPRPAHAQALQPVVDVCTGVGIDDSALRTLLQRTLVPVANGVEGLFDDLLTVNILGVPLLSIPDVDLGVAATAADIAAGNTVSLQVLDTDGNVVASGSCNVTTDGYALNTPAGIAVGGNRIGGLGNGAAATAAELDAIAVGNGASTGVEAAGAVALGAGASVTAANGVAIGAGSTNARGAAAGYAAFGLAAPASSAGTVSFGAPGAERQLTNIAPGTAATDAATVGQVQGAFATLQADLAVLSFDAVQYDSPTHGSVTFGGAGGTTLANVAAGAVAPGSMEAVNGSQLYATNQQVAANTAAIGGLDARVTQNTSDISNLSTQVAQNTGDIANLGTQVAQNTTDITNIDARVTSNTDAISQIGTSLTAIDARVTSNTTQIAAVQAQVNNVPVRYVSNADGSTPAVGPTDTVAFTGASGGAVRVANVADATAATDAVNLRQLQASMAQLQGGLSQTLADANAYTDLRIAEIGFDFDGLRDEAFAGTAAAMALATIPQTMEAGKSLIGGAVGHYRGQTAFGFGVSTAGDDVAFKASGTIDMNGKGGIAVGAGVSF